MPSVAQLFACNYDAILFVDDGSGGPEDQDGSKLLVGRLITRVDWPWVRRIDEVLREERADTWHASKRGASHLFRSMAAEALCRMIGREGGGHVFDWRVTPSVLRNLGEQYRTLAERTSGRSVSWPLRADAAPSEIMWLGYLARVQQHIALMQYRGTLPGRRTLIVGDRSHWKSATHEWYREVPMPIDHDLITHGFRFEFRSVIDKRHAEAAGVLRWLGLVDSEAWAMGRMMRAVLGDGRSVDERLKEWARDGRPEDRVVLTQDDQAQLLLDPPLLGTYFEEVMIRMRSEGRVVHLDNEPQ